MNSSLSKDTAGASRAAGAGRGADALRWKVPAGTLRTREGARSRASATGEASRLGGGGGAAGLGGARLLPQRDDGSLGSRLRQSRVGEGFARLCFPSTRVEGFGLL